MIVTRKRFGQHFLQDSQVVHQIVQAIAPSASDHIIEIGPGLGALTAPLVASGCTLSLIEIDRDLTQQLTSRFPDARIYNEDVLKTDLPAILQRQPRARIVGNLPYNISTPLMFKLFNHAADIEDMYFMLQREVVDRLCAHPSTPDYGRLSVMAQYHCHTEKLFEVPPYAFQPSPRVQSAFVRLSPRDDKPHTEDPRILEALLRQAFSKRRKTLRNAMKNYLTDTDLLACGLDSGLRPENLNVNQYVTCANHIARKVAKNAAKNAAKNVAKMPAGNQPRT